MSQVFHGEKSQLFFVRNYAKDVYPRLLHQRYIHRLEVVHVAYLVDNDAAKIDIAQCQMLLNKYHIIYDIVFIAAHNHDQLSIQVRSQREDIEKERDAELDVLAPFYKQDILISANLFGHLKNAVASPLFIVFEAQLQMLEANRHIFRLLVQFENIGH